MKRGREGGEGSREREKGKTAGKQGQVCVRAGIPYSMLL